MLFVQDAVPVGLPMLTACHVSAYSRPLSRSRTCGTPTPSLPYTLGAGTAELTFIQPSASAQGALKCPVPPGRTGWWIVAMGQGSQRNHPHPVAGRG